ncbi:putative homoserine dehydrogenase [Beggiatoa alba B18LD]|uniref:Putative homoserine dehydrogenase n=1 Tax=Beggiatoa alba B18LD TaxID=395493 RepID=I3CCB5_9GAMM|nr:Gfo/Idh/MocA family oxidoreductase [Beggiatoa alba]EIJ41258.1 putative homoserine dehydrogenase [Beggiatoa alba B18LD]
MTVQKTKINIAIIGAGETGTPLLKQLSASSFIQIVAVADVNQDTVGMRLAREQGIHTTQDFMEIANMGETVDIIIEVTGKTEVREQLRQALYKTGNNHTVIMHEIIAILLMSLSQGELVQIKHEEGLAYA